MRVFFVFLLTYSYLCRQNKILMAEIQEETEKWYVLGCLSVHREEKVRDALRKAGFRSHVPMKYEVKHVRRQE